MERNKISKSLSLTLSGFPCVINVCQVSVVFIERIPKCFHIVLVLSLLKPPSKLVSAQERDFV